MLHFTGIDLEPYTRLAAAFLARINGEPVTGGPTPATFTDGLAAVRVLEAIRRSSAEHAWQAQGCRSRRNGSAPPRLGRRPRTSVGWRHDDGHPP